MSAEGGSGWNRGSNRRILSSKALAASVGKNGGCIPNPIGGSVSASSLMLRRR